MSEEIRHSPLCRREIRKLEDKAYYELRWVCVKNCKADTNA